MATIQSLMLYQANLWQIASFEPSAAV